MRRLAIVALVVLALLTAGSARGDEQPSAPPVLRLETGMHTAPIRAAAVDASGAPPCNSLVRQNRAAVVAAGRRAIAGAASSHRVRPEGELFGVAVSPDGRFVVIGGWTGFEREKANTLYVFETGTGQLVRRIGGLPQVIDRLAWSQDRRYVAVGLAGANGIRVFETGDGHEVFADVDYTGAV